MTVVVLGLIASLLYGVSDFFGAVASRSRPATGVAFAALAVSAVAILPAFALVDSVWSVPAIVFGALAGGVAGLGVLLLYAALAAGPVGFVSPVVALMSAVLPALFAFAAGERTSGWALVALGAVVVGGVLIGAEPDEGLRPRRRTVALTLVTALHLPGLAIVAALSALYPVTTVGLAVVVLHERLRVQHAAGLAIAVLGVAGLALARG